MAGKLDLAPLPPFDPLSEPSSLSQRWKSWIKRFETYIVAMKITDNKQKRALLLYQAGEATQDIFETLQNTGDDYQTAKQRLEEYFAPRKNVDFQVFQFRQTAQLPDEPIDQFVTRLHKLAATCEFHDVSREIKSTVIQNCSSKRLRRYALRETDITLDHLIAKARSLEISEAQASGIEKTVTSEDVNRVSYNYKRPIKPVFQPQQCVKSQQPLNRCRNCGLIWPHTTGPCPAKGQQCYNCGKLNHFAKVCRSKPTSSHKPEITQMPKNDAANQITADPDSSSDDEYMYALNMDAPVSKVPTVSVQISGTTVNMIIDTGASIDILDEPTYNKVHQHNNILLTPSLKRLFAYGSSTQLKVLGSFQSLISVDDAQCVSTFHVLEGNHGSLLSYATAVKLGILQLQVNLIESSSNHFLNQYPSVFKGIGKLTGVEVMLHIDPDVSPVAQKPRRIPFHLRKKVEQELLALEQQNIIEKVDGPTPWVSPLVVIPKKNGDVRLCVDMRVWLTRLSSANVIQSQQ